MDEVERVVGEADARRAEGRGSETWRESSDSRTGSTLPAVGSSDETPWEGMDFPCPFLTTSYPSTPSPRRFN